MRHIEATVTGLVIATVAFNLTYAWWYLAHTDADDLNFPRT